MTVRNLLATKRFPVEAVADVVIESRNVRSRPQARLRLTNGLEVALDSLTAGYDDSSRRELHEDVSRLRNCLNL